eukprot:MONOS_9325.1-p1 / transcript=MONOS_9325.1 / gene=MONOS_9325 / organism=Monocercomonoides_exilis_PA203 / gene_product=unspecified product / transcript_product=unspecified product / location=Mono_scaffold00381:128-1239(-) / protein_length=345 / sequence_SO=supercontig / SO=protein_coding / is_pseudo=false
MRSLRFEKSSLNKRFEQMIIAENKKMDEKDEKLLVDLCECYISLNISFKPELLLMCMPYLMKVALKKEKSEETQKEVDMALLTLRDMGFCLLMQKQYFNEIKEIIKYHHEHRNLSRLAYWCAWKFLIDRLFFDVSVEEVIVNDLHFARETAREIEDLSKYVDWRREKEEERVNETKEEILLMEWLRKLVFFFRSCGMWNEEFAALIESIVRVLRAAKDKHGDFFGKCIYVLYVAIGDKDIKIDCLLKGGAIDAFLEEIHQLTFNQNIVRKSLMFFLDLSEKLKKKTKGEVEEAKRKELKKQLFRMLEEEGYEDVIESLYGFIYFAKEKNDRELSLNISDYNVNV